jgi:hypothetical protein
MDYHVRARFNAPLREIALSEVTDEYVYAREHVGEPPRLGGVGEAVSHDDRVTRSDKMARQVRPDEPKAARDEDSHT